MIYGMTDQTPVAAQVIADVVAEHGDGSQLMLEQARADLLVRLHNRSDDFAATRELQAVSARLSQLKLHTTLARTRRRS